VAMRLWPPVSFLTGIYSKPLAQRAQRLLRYTRPLGTHHY